MAEAIGFVYPTEREWQNAAARGDRAAAEAMLHVTQQMQQEDANPALVFALFLGAISAIGNLIMVSVQTDSMHTTERTALAVLRGALRGSGVALKDSGQPFVEATNG